LLAHDEMVASMLKWTVRLHVVSIGLLVASLLMSCASAMPGPTAPEYGPGPITVWWDTATTTPSATMAIDVYNANVCHGQMLRRTTNIHNADILIRVASPASMGPPCDKPGIQGCADLKPRGCLIHIRPQMSEFDQVRIVAHEIGHCLGLEHDEFRRTSFMTTGMLAVGPIVLDPRDRADLRGRYCE